MVSLPYPLTKAGEAHIRFRSGTKNETASLSDVELQSGFAHLSIEAILGHPSLMDIRKSDPLTLVRGFETLGIFSVLTSQ